MQTAARTPLDPITEAAIRKATEGSTTPPSVVKGLTGVFCASADIVLLSTILILLAADASAARLNMRLSDLLAMKLSISHFVTLVLCCVIWRLTFWYCGLYTPQAIASAKVMVGRLALTVIPTALVSAGVIAVVWQHRDFARYAVLFWLAELVSLMVLRATVAGFFLYVRPALRHQRSVIVIGTGSRAKQACRELQLHPEWKYTVLGFVSLQPAVSKEAPDATLGTLKELESILMEHAVDEVITVLPIRSHFTAIEQAIAVCERAGVQVQYYADLFETSVTKNICSDGHGISQRVVLKMVHDDRRRNLKRAFDIAGATLGLTLLLPLFVAVAILIKCTSKGPVFFRQKRYGFNRRLFYVYKFRSMVADAEARQAHVEHLNQFSGAAFKIFNDPRVTKVGAILRRTSIDELPQLFNVLKGEMSLVGPRPMSLRDVGRFSELRLMRRFSVKPGLTCLWQVCGRSNVTFDHWMDLDLQYIDNWSLALDMKILAQTLPAVISCRGAA